MNIVLENIYPNIQIFAGPIFTGKFLKEIIFKLMTKSKENISSFEVTYYPE